MKKIISLILLCALVLTLGACAAEKTNTNKLTNNTATPTEQAQNNNAANIPQNSAPALDENLNYYADIDVKDYGKIFPGLGGVLDRFDSIIPVSVITAVFFAFIAL